MRRPHALNYPRNRRVVVGEDWWPLPNLFTPRTTLVIDDERGESREREVLSDLALSADAVHRAPPSQKSLDANSPKVYK